MNKEQQQLFEQLTPLQQRVCTNKLEGMTNHEAYVKAGGKAKTKTAQDTGASEILNNPQCKAYLLAMKESIVNDAIMTRETMLERLSQIANINVADYLKAGITELTENKKGYELKVKSALQAMKQLSDLQGYDSAKQLEVKGTFVSYSADDYKDAEQRLKEMGLD